MFKVSASVADVQFEAKVRVIMKPLVGLIPIVGGVQDRSNSMQFVYYLEFIINLMLTFSVFGQMLR